MKAAKLDLVLGDAVARALIYEQTAGPGGHPGVLFSLPVHQPPWDGHPGIGPPGNYRPSEQVWAECEGYWVGIERGSPPAPVDVQFSDKVIEDYAVTLRDGKKWSVYCVEPTVRVGSVPRVPKRDNGQVVWVPEWQVESNGRMAAIAAKLRTVYDAESFSLNDWLDMACMTLLANYRMHVDLAIVMNLLTDKLCDDVIEKGMDQPAIAEYLERKKKEEQPQGG